VTYYALIGVLSFINEHRCMFYSVVNFASFSLAGVITRSFNVRSRLFFHLYHTGKRRIGNGKLCNFLKIHRFVCVLFVFFALLLSVWHMESAYGQSGDVSVSIDDSAEALKIFHEAGDHHRQGNTALAVGLYQRLLDEYSDYLMPASTLDEGEMSDRFTSVRFRVLRVLVDDAVLLTAYRSRYGAAAESLLDTNELEVVYESFCLTEAGLSTGLRLVERHVLDGQFVSAVGMLCALEGHPDVSGDDATLQYQRRWARLLGMAGLYGEDESVYAKAVGVLSDIGMEDVETLERWKTAFVAPEPREGLTPIDIATNEEPATLGSMSRHPVWVRELETRLSAALASPLISQAQERRVRLDSESGQHMRMIPSVCDDLVYVNDGLTVAAIDRYDGGVAWRYRSETNLTPASIVTVHTSPWDSMTVSPNGVAVSNVYAVSIVWNQQPNEGRLEPTRLGCFDRMTGEVLWSRLPEEYDGDFDGGAFVGLPVIQEGFVFVGVRRLAQQLGSDYLVAIDVASGELVWKRYLVSSEVGRGWSPLPCVQPVWSDGVVYVNSPLGCVAAIQASRGEVRWLEVYRPISDTSLSIDPLAWAFDAPLVTRVGLFSMTPDRQAVVLLDPHDGERLAYMTRSRLGRPRYLLADDSALFAVGETIVRLSLDDVAGEPTVVVSPGPNHVISGRVCDRG